MPSETTTACVRLLVFFRIRRSTFPYGVEDDASTISLTPTTHYTNTCVKLTIVTHLSFSERIAIADLSYKRCKMRFCSAFQFFGIQNTYMKRHSIYRYNVVSGNVYARSARHCGPHLFSIKKINHQLA